MCGERRKSKMIEIKCSKAQRAIIIQCLLSPTGCLWPRKQAYCVYDQNASCKKCFATKIKWVHGKETVKNGGT